MSAGRKKLAVRVFGTPDVGRIACCRLFLKKRISDVF